MSENYLSQLNKPNDIPFDQTQKNINNSRLKILEKQQTRERTSMKITKILEKPNQFPEVNEKYEPLKKNIQNPKQPPVEEIIEKKSYVSRRLKSLSPNQAELIKTVTYIPENCRLKVTSNEEKQQKAFSQKYIAINMEEKINSKPISPNTFQTIPKNKKVEIVYEYNPLNGNDTIEQYNQGYVHSKNDDKSSRENYFQTNENQTQNSRKSYYVANEENLNYNGPAFFETKGRGGYNQMVRNAKQEFESKAKDSQHSGKIEIGGRNKLSPKQTLNSFESNNVMNSRNSNNNYRDGQRDYSENYTTKEDALEGQETEVKGEYFPVEEYENERNSRMGDYVKNAESELVDYNEGKSNPKNGKKREIFKKTDYPEFKAEYPPDQVSQELLESSPEIQERKRKLREYQESGSRGYTFKKSEENDQKRKKEGYKYNLFSMLDEQVNLKCATGVFTPNELCASEPKRQVWN